MQSRLHIEFNYTIIIHLYRGVGMSFDFHTVPIIYFFTYVNVSEKKNHRIINLYLNSVNIQTPIFTSTA